MKTWLLLAVLVAPLAAKADGAIDGGIAYSLTSDETEQTEIDIGYRNHRRYLFWPFLNESRSRWDAGGEAHTYIGRTVNGHFNGAKMAGLVGYRPTANTQLVFRAGVHALQVAENNKTRTLPYGEIDFFWRPLPYLDIHTFVNHDFFYQEFLQAGAIEAGLQGYTVGTDGSFRLHNRWRIPWRASYKDLNDNNSRRMGDIALMYGISPGEPWIWAGVAYEYLGHKFNTPTYWSPKKFWSAGIRIEGDIPIGHPWNIFFGLNVNRFREESYAMGTGYYGVAGLRYGGREETNYSLSYTRIRSAQNSGMWSSDQATFLVHVPL